jgi:hypothetical protein
LSFFIQTHSHYLRTAHKRRDDADRLITAAIAPFKVDAPLEMEPRMQINPTLNALNVYYTRGESAFSVAVAVAVLSH